MSLNFFLLSMSRKVFRESPNVMLRWLAVFPKLSYEALLFSMT
jgi:hypothetical protein